MDLFLRILCVGGAGALGALARWGVTWLVEIAAGRRMLEIWPIATLIVNGTGCFLFGLLFEMFRHRVPVDDPWRLAVFVGFLGAFTTYSTFAFDVFRLHTEQTLLSASVYLITQIAIGWIALVGGLFVGRVLA